MVNFFDLLCTLTGTSPVSSAVSVPLGFSIRFWGKRCCVVDQDGLNNAGLASPPKFIRDGRGVRGDERMEELSREDGFRIDVHQ